MADTFSRHRKATCGPRPDVFPPLNNGRTERISALRLCTDACPCANMYGAQGCTKNIINTQYRLYGDR